MDNEKNRIKANLLSWEDFKKDEISTPYVYRIDAGDKELVYFGTRHSFDPEDSLFKKLRKAWEDFREGKDWQETIVVVEGQERDLGQTERDAIVNHGGEGGFITYLANAHRIEREAFEPPQAERLSALAERFNASQVLYYYGANILYQWNQLTDQPPVDDYVNYFFSELKDTMDWPKATFSLSGLKTTHGNLFAEPFDHTDGEFFHKVINPAEKNGVINEISRADHEMKDVAVVEGIKEYWDNDYSIFVVYGIGHAVIQEPAIKEALGVKG